MNCPIDRVVVNEQKIRLVAFFVFLLVLFNFMQPNIFLSLYITVDFYCRAFLEGKFSVLSSIAGKLEKYDWIGIKNVDRAPKRFAAMIGFFMSLLLVITVLLNSTIFINIISFVFISFSFLEFAFGFCAGCYLYHFLQYFKSNYAKDL